MTKSVPAICTIAAHVVRSEKCAIDSDHPFQRQLERGIIVDATRMRGIVCRAARQVSAVVMR
ncbi:hypothetical protein ACFQS6_15265 [Xanthomonas populi]|uniref:Uncharacterized protein n=1 Tax=Xanthomonas populi TaxID=53414 RepID=A0A2S7EMM2_9XANT|nr:hypothetical protein [Xanthomonas populi]PPU91891.1 hypothetical protein XpopCFBP1817_12935 [Xanthomonas populi]